MNKIYFIRGKKVMLDRDLADLYGVETKNLKRQVRRNELRFPEDFMFELNDEGFESLSTAECVLQTASCPLLSADWLPVSSAEKSK